MPDHEVESFDGRFQNIGHMQTQTEMTRKLKNRSGFTLMELMVTIAIIGILAAIAIPNAISWRNNAQFNSAVRDVKKVVEDTRMAAIRANLPAVVAFTVGANTFNTQRWDRTVGALGAANIHQLPPSVTITNTTIGGGGGQLVFNNRGMANLTNGSVTIQHTDGMFRQIIVSAVGSSRIQ